MKGDDAVGLVHGIGAEIRDHAVRYGLVFLRRAHHAIVRGEFRQIACRDLCGKARTVKHQHAFGIRPEGLDCGAIRAHIS